MTQSDDTLSEEALRFVVKLKNGEPRPTMEEARTWWNEAATPAEKAPYLSLARGRAITTSPEHFIKGGQDLEDFLFFKLYLFYKANGISADTASIYADTDMHIDREVPYDEYLRLMREKDIPDIASKFRSDDRYNKALLRQHLRKAGQHYAADRTSPPNLETRFSHLHSHIGILVLEARMNPDLFIYKETGKWADGHSKNDTHIPAAVEALLSR